MKLSWGFSKNIWRSKDGIVYAQKMIEKNNNKINLPKKTAELITLYNEEQVDALGWQYEASLVLGIDYYLYEKKYWVHGWASVMPFSKGLTDYSFVYESGDIDFDIGLVAGY